MDHLAIAERIKAAHAVLIAKGFEKACVSLGIEHWPYCNIEAHRPRAMVAPEIGQRVLFESFDTVDLALDAIDATVATVWGADDVSGTLGLPICGLCDPDPSRPGIFRDHNCWKCKDGKLPCAKGHTLNCEFPHARND